MLKLLLISAFALKIQDKPLRYILKGWWIFVIALKRFIDKTQRQNLNMFATCFQFEIKPAARSYTFSRAFRCRASHRLRVFTSSFDWFIGFSVPLTSQRDNFGFGISVEFCTCTLFHETSARMRNVAGSWKKKYMYKFQACLHFTKHRLTKM